MKIQFDYDGALKQLFQHDPPGFLDELTGKVPIREFLNVELPRVQHARVDLLLSLADDTILQVEFQSRNDRTMALRMAEYYLMLVRRYGRPVRHVVLYAGQDRLNMSARLNTGKLQFTYELLDLRDVPLDRFLRYGRPADVALAILAGDAPGRLPELFAAVLRLAPAEQPKAIAMMVLLGGLRSLSGKLETELTGMPLTIDISKNVILQRIWNEGAAAGEARGEARGQARGEAKGEARGVALGQTKALQTMLTRQFRAKFGSVPRWAQDRLKSATIKQLEAWGERTIHAARIEDVIGPREPRTTNHHLRA